MKLLCSIIYTSKILSS